MVNGQSPELAAWIAFYCENDPHINAIINLFELNVDKLFLKRPPEKPDFKLIFPKELTKPKYVQIV